MPGTTPRRRVMGGAFADDLSDDEPRFDYPVEIELTCSELILIFDKRERVFLLKCENDEGVSVKLSLTLHELERAAIELLLAAREYLGLKRAARRYRSSR
jgi:hypothetical protein